jgi:hypothetical protein
MIQRIGHRPEEETPMSILSNYRRTTPDHFEPESNLDPAAQRRLRGQLEHIDYTAFASNKGVIGAKIGRVDAESFQRLAIAAAEARTRWVQAGLEISQHPQAITPEQIERLAHLKHAFHELTDVYEGMRRMVERGYLPTGG